MRGSLGGSAPASIATGREQEPLRCGVNSLDLFRRKRTILAASLDFRDSSAEAIERAAQLCLRGCPVDVAFVRIGQAGLCVGGLTASTKKSPLSAADAAQPALRHRSGRCDLSANPM
jgi:hypothetical protein